MEEIAALHCVPFAMTQVSFLVVAPQRLGRCSIRKKLSSMSSLCAPAQRAAWRGVANGAYGVKQSPRQVGDRFVAKDAPRDDTRKFLGSVSEAIPRYAARLLR